MGQLTDVYHSVLSDIGKGLLTVQYSTYVVAGRTAEWADEDSPPDIVGTQAQIGDLRSNMIAGVKIDVADVVNVVNRNTWQSGIFYDQWDQNADLENIVYYVINSNRDVFICLFNNEGGASTIEPTTKATTPFTLADGYIWKYLYTVSESDESKFGTDDYIPLTPNTSITSAAIRGTIYAYDVKTSGITFYNQEEGVITDVVSSNTFRLDNSSNAAGNTFGGSALYIPDGTGAGSLVGIVSSFANASGRYITTDSPLSLDLTSEYVLGPKVTVTGDGVGAKAVAIVENRTLTKVLSINPGNNYSYADVTVAVNPAFAATANVQALISPITGHGANTNIELVSKKLAISTRIEPDVHPDLPPGINYRQIGVIMAPWSPAFALCNTETITFATSLSISSGTFNAGDNVVGLSSGTLGTVYKANSSVVKVIGVTGAFTNNEVLSCNTTGVSTTIQGVTQRDADKNSGQVVYYTNLQAINRSNTSAENVHIIINFEG